MIMLSNIKCFRNQLMGLHWMHYWSLFTTTYTTRSSSFTKSCAGHWIGYKKYETLMEGHCVGKARDQSPTRLNSSLTQSPRVCCAQSFSYKVLHILASQELNWIWLTVKISKPLDQKSSTKSKNVNNPLIRCNISHRTYILRKIGSRNLGIASRNYSVVVFQIWFWEHNYKIRQPLHCSE